MRTACCIGRRDSSTAPSSRPKRGLAVGKTSAANGVKRMVLEDGQRLPLRVHLEGSSPAEVTLAEVRVLRVQRRGAAKAEAGSHKHLLSAACAFSHLACCWITLRRCF